MDNFDLPEIDEAEMEKRHNELIENQPEHEPNDGCEGGACVI